MKCSGFTHDDRDWDPKRPHLWLCRCPTCKGFLPSSFPNDKPFVCKKCGTELMVFPINHEVDEEHWDWEGKICPISEPRTKLLLCAKEEK